MIYIDRFEVYNAINDAVESNALSYEGCVNQILVSVAKIPAADVAPVVRCMDCKYSEHWYGDRNRCFLWVEDGIGVFEDGFCSYGERKGGDK